MNPANLLQVDGQLLDHADRKNRATVLSSLTDSDDQRMLVEIEIMHP